MRMRKPLMGMLLMMTAASGVAAQEGNWASGTAKNNDNAAPAFSETSAARVNLYSGDAAEARNFALAAPSEAAPAEPAAAPTPKPRYIFGDRDDYRWQLGLGLEFFRFQSKIFSASMLGLNTTVTYFTNDWLALEGNLVTGFAPQIYDRAHVKYFGGAGGLRIGTRRARFEPWGHALVGGGHMQPQTAGNSRNALVVQAGVGVDYRVHSRLSFRVEADYVRSQFFNDAQNNFQGVAGMVFHF